MTIPTSIEFQANTWMVILLLFVISVVITVWKLRKKKCNHKWVKMSNVILDSANEQISKGLEGGGHIQMEGTGMPRKLLFKKKHIFIMACSKCGTPYKSVEVNPE